MPRAQKADGKTEYVISDYSKIVELDPDNVDIATLLGNTLATTQQTERAARVFDELIKRAPNFAEAYNNRGLLSLQSRKRKAGESRF